jgi:TRAP-type C4-dicarboxylate transport system substrate-binding protein
MVRIGRVTALLLVGAALAGCAGPAVDKAGGARAAKPVVLTLANPLGDSEEVQGFAGEVARLSGGTLRIDVESRWRNGQTDFEDGLIGDVRAGKADLGVVGSRAWESVGVTIFQALGAPLLIDSYALQDQVITSPMTGQMLKGLEPLGLVGLGVLPGPLRYPVGAARPLLGPSSYAGLRIGVQQSLVASMTLRALGATPVWFPAAGPVTGLDGVEQSINNVQSAPYDQVRRYLTGNVVLWPRPLVVFANGKAFAKLTAAQQRVLREAVVGDVTAETAFVHSSELTATANLCRDRRVQFVAASPADIIALRRAVQPVYDQLDRDPATRREIAQIQAMRAQVPPEPPPRCPRAPVSGAEAGQLDGTWRFTITRAELSAAGAQLGELIPANYGTWTVVIGHRRFAWVTQNPPNCTWAYGTLTVDGSTLAMSVINGGGIAPDGGTNAPGEYFTYRWSLYRDQLTLRRYGATSPTPLLATAWRRISAAPSMTFFSKRCPPPANALGR